MQVIYLDITSKYRLFFNSFLLQNYKKSSDLLKSLLTRQGLVNLYIII